MLELSSQPKWIFVMTAATPRGKPPQAIFPITVYLVTRKQYLPDSLSNMAESKESKRPIDIGRLKSLYSSPPPTGLNAPLRNELKTFAASNKCNFAVSICRNTFSRCFFWITEYLPYVQQDNVGNIYITRPGTDASLSGIALTFPLDASSSPQHNSFSGAIHTFLELLQTNTKCEICLLGWSSPGNSSVGHDVWEEEYSVEETYEKYPELKIFAGSDDVSAFGCSALLEIVEVKGAAAAAALEVRGSALLAEKASAYLPANNGTVGGVGGEEGPSSLRCPVLCIRGEGAVGVGKGVVVEYSEYVAKLFENFD